jgi:predicted RNA-binding Zn ribbon-like protein
MTAGTSRFRQGAGRISLDFLRTLRYRGRREQTEELGDEVALAAWLGQFGPALPALDERPPSGAELPGARRLREAIFELITATRAGTACPAATLDIVNRAASRDVPAPMIDPDGQLSWHAPDPVPAVLALVARDALDLVTTPAIARLRECGNPDCQVLFLDSSRPGARRWCDMSTCGNQAKKAVFRTKTTTNRPILTQPELVAHPGR